MKFSESVMGVPNTPYQYVNNIQPRYAAWVALK